MPRRADWVGRALVVFLRLVGRGLKDVFDQLLSLTLMSLLFWAGLISIVFAAPTIVTMFGMADPRRQVKSPELRDAIPMFRGSFRRSWGVFLCSIPLIVILVWNTTYFSGTGDALQVMVPLWLLMTVILIVVTLFAFSVAATMESSVRNAFRGAMYVLVRNPFQGLVLSLLLIVLAVVMTLAVVPMLFLGPAVIASIVNRFVLWGLGEEVIDPNAPTDERAFEQERGINPDKSIVERLRGSGRR